MAIQYSTVHRTARATGLNTDLGASAVLKIYSGTKPANVAASITGTLLSTHTCNAGGFGSASAGALTASAIGGATAAATGTASHFRIETSGGTVIMQGDVAASGSDLNLTGGPGITSGQSVTISSFVDTMFGA